MFFLEGDDRKTSSASYLKVTTQPHRGTRRIAVSSDRSGADNLRERRVDASSFSSRAMSMSRSIICLTVVFNTFLSRC